MPGRHLQKSNPDTKHRENSWRCVWPTEMLLEILLGCNMPTSSPQLGRGEEMGHICQLYRKTFSATQAQPLLRSRPVARVAFRKIGNCKLQWLTRYHNVLPDEGVTLTTNKLLYIVPRRTGSQNIAVHQRWKSEGLTASGQPYIRTQKRSSGSRSHEKCTTIVLGKA